MPAVLRAVRPRGDVDGCISPRTWCDSRVAGARVALRMTRAEMQGPGRRRETKLRDLTARGESANPRLAEIFGILARNIAGVLTHGTHGALAETRFEHATASVAIGVRRDSRLDVGPPLPPARSRVTPSIVEVPGIPHRCVATRGGARSPLRRLVAESATGSRGIVILAPMRHRHAAVDAAPTVTIGPCCNVHGASGAVRPSAADSGNVP